MSRITPYCVSSNTFEFENLDQYHFTQLQMDAAEIEFGVKDTSVRTVVPNDDIARLMYYLHCIDACLQIASLDYALTDYRNYRRLSPQGRRLVVEWATLLDPRELIDEVIFLDDEQVMTATLDNAICEVSVACHLISIRSTAIVAGGVQEISKVMFFRSKWLVNNYIEPLQRITRPVVYYIEPPRRAGREDCIIQ
jgi:hypothetical protein